MINAFLSYRHKNEHAITARSALKALCENTDNIKLVFDEDVTEQNDNLVVFMQDLVDARCIFIFLDPDYFESAYTLFELISINEQEGFDKRFVHPVRVTAAMRTYVRTDAKQYWQANEKIRNETARLLVNTSRLKDAEREDHDAIWRRIDNAWTNLIEDPLDHLKYPATENGKVTSILQGCVEMIIPTIQKVKHSQSEKLSDYIKQKIVVLLNHKTIPLDDLAEELDDPSGGVQGDAESIASYMTSGMLIVIDILAALIRVMEAQKDSLGSDSEQWRIVLMMASS